MTPAPVKPTVPLAALEALDVRVGTITKVEDVPSSSSSRASPSPSATISGRSSQGSARSARIRGSSKEGRLSSS